MLQGLKRLNKELDISKIAKDVRLLKEDAKLRGF